ncbi:MAG: hypothetical protein ACREQL_15290, partial [Candidatus Binatia bacterium]
MSPIHFPSQAFLASYTPEGIVLPPIFEPQFDPTAASEAKLFGSADAPYTILRLAKFRGTCQGGRMPGSACAATADCRGGVCVASCAGGGNEGVPCASDGGCSGGVCGRLFEFTDRIPSDGAPVSIARFAQDGVCEDTGAVCSTPGTCGSAACVDYRVAANDPVPLDGIAGSSEVFTFSISEAIAGRDLNGDGDTGDAVVTLRNRTTGTALPIGTAEGLAVTRIRQDGFSYPAVASEGSIVAFLEPEPLQGDCASTPGACDKNGDGDLADSILRVYRDEGGVSPTAVTQGENLPASPEPLVNGRSLEVSGSFVVFREAEWENAPVTTERISVSSTGVEGDARSGGLGPRRFATTMSRDGRHVSFVSDASNLVAGDTNGTTDVFVRDLDTDTTVRVSVDDAGTEGNGTSGGVVPNVFAAESTGTCLSADGRFVAFVSAATNFDSPDTNGTTVDVYVHDRDTDQNAVFDEAGGIKTVRVSTASNGTPAEAGSTVLMLPTSCMSPDGRFVMFASSATNLVTPDANGTALDGFLHDRDADADGIFDESGTVTTTRINVDSFGTQANDRLEFGPVLSPDGRWVFFNTPATNVVTPDTNGAASDVFAHDLVTGVTTRVSVASDGTQPNTGAFGAALSDDGHVVGLVSDASNVVAGDTNGTYDGFLHYRDPDGNGVLDEPGAIVTRRFSLSSSGTQGNGPSSAGGMSGDGRYIAFSGFASNLVAGDGNALCDTFLSDALTGLTTALSVQPSGLIGAGDNACNLSDVDLPAISADGHRVAFVSNASNLVPGDTNGVPDVFVRGVDPNDPTGDLTGDGDIGDTVLSVLDGAGTAGTTPVRICPAGEVAVAGTTIAFLRPEAAGTTPALPPCPVGPTTPDDLNDDGDAADEVVHLYRSATVTNLGRAATAVATSETWVAALVSEAGEGGPPLNGDGDTADDVIETFG